MHIPILAPDLKGGGLHFIVALITSLAFIWYGDEIGEVTGKFDLHEIDTKTPGFLIKGAGWIFLVIIGIITVKEVFQ